MTILQICAQSNKNPGNGESFSLILHAPNEKKGRHRIYIYYPAD
jgi:hypothetical protein